MLSCSIVRTIKAMARLVVAIVVAAALVGGQVVYADGNSAHIQVGNTSGGCNGSGDCGAKKRSCSGNQCNSGSHMISQQDNDNNTTNNYFGCVGGSCGSPCRGGGCGGGAGFGGGGFGGNLLGLGTIGLLTGLILSNNNQGGGTTIINNNNNNNYYGCCDKPTPVPTIPIFPTLPPPTALPTPVSTSTPLPTVTPQPTKTPEPTKTAQPTKTSEPTKTPQPTATPHQSATPEPTCTVIPTETPCPTNTPLGTIPGVLPTPPGLAPIKKHETPAAHPHSATGTSLKDVQMMLSASQPAQVAPAARRGRPAEFMDVRVDQF